MPDITMCSGDGCVLRNTCYRYLAKPSEFMQSYFVQPPIKDGRCESYWKDRLTTNRDEISSTAPAESPSPPP
jgi:hypothetical protein